MSDHIYLTAVNLLLCAAWGGGAFMRLRVTHSGVLIRIRAIYACMVMSAAASGFRFQLFGEYAGYADLTVSFTMVCFILLGTKRWRHGTPNELIKSSNRLF
jgi:hypothetical protein